MRLVEFLIQILQAQADTLLRLAAFFGEEELVEILELAGDQPQPDVVIDLHQGALENKQPGGGSCFQELEGAVRELGLPEPLEFHLWAYPHYRAFIESPLDLNSRIPGPGGDTGTQMVEEAVVQAQAWVKHLPLPPQVSLQAERAAFVPWLRFRTNVLKRIGRRPMGPVY